VARPVQQLSSAAAALTAGTFDAPLPISRIYELARVAGTFDDLVQNAREVAADRS
jgi:HAMP domain-containing protein